MDSLSVNPFSVVGNVIEESIAGGEGFKGLVKLGSDIGVAKLAEGGNEGPNFRLVDCRGWIPSFFPLGLEKH